MGRRVFLTVSKSPEIAHKSYPASQYVPGHSFLQCFMKPFVNQGISLLWRLLKDCFKGRFLGMSVLVGDIF